VNTLPETTDMLPEDLQPSFGAEEYQIPNTDKRKLAACLYLITGVIFVSLSLLFSDSPLVNNGFLVSGVCIILFSGYNFFAAVRCSIDEREALQVASVSVGFEIGPASAQLMWRGYRSRPVWRLLAYSSEPTPLQRAVVLLDASTGEVLEQVVEENPEEWVNAS